MQKALTNEAELIARVLMDKDQHAFSLLVKHYQCQIRQYCRRLCSNDVTIADDIAQETFIQAYKKIALYQGRGKFIGWLFRIAYFQYLQMLRARKLYDEFDDSCASNNAEQDFSHDLNRQQDLEKALEQLSLNERTCVTLQFSFGYSQAEIAEMLDMPLGTVKSYVKRGKDKLAYILSAEVSNETSPISGAA